MNGFGPAPLPAAIFSMVRPEATDRSGANTASPSPSVAYLSRCFDQQPVGSLPSVPVMLHPHKDETPVQTFAIERELEIAFFQCLFWRHRALRLPISAVPQLHRTATILAFGDRAFEVPVIQRVVLNLDCEALVMRVQGRTFGDSPRFEDTTEFKTKIVVQPRGRMLLNDKPKPVRFYDRTFAAGFFRLA